MYQERKEDRSIYYWLKSLFPTFVTVKDGFPNEDIVLPSIAFEWDTIDGRHFELGNREVLKERDWYIHIYANTKDQRDEFAYMLFNALEDGIPVQNYDEGFPESGVTPSTIGRLLTKRRQAKNIPVDPDLVDELYYRAVVIFTAVYQQT